MADTATAAVSDRVLVGDIEFRSDPDSAETPLAWALALEIGRPAPTGKARRGGRQ